MFDFKANLNAIFFSSTILLHSNSDTLITHALYMLLYVQTPMHDSLLIVFKINWPNQMQMSTFLVLKSINVAARN